MLYKLSPHLQFESDGQGTVQLQLDDFSWKIPDDDFLGVIAEFIVPGDINDVLLRAPENVQAIIKQMREMGALVPDETLLPASRFNGIASKLNRECGQLFVFFAGQLLLVTEQQDVSGHLGALDLSDRNLLSLRDVSYQGYRHGVAEEVPSLRELIAWLRGHIDAMPWVSEVHFLGMSMGAFPAIIAGHHIGADSVITLGLPKASDPLGPETDPQLEWNLANLLSDHNGKTRYLLYYGTRHQRDRSAAEALAGLPGVELKPVDTDEHAVADVLNREGRLADISAPYLSSGLSAESSRTRGDARLPTGTELAERIELLRRGDIKDLRPDASLLGVLDSFALVQLLSEIEENHGVRLDPAVLGPEAFATANTIAETIGTLVEAGGRASTAEPGRFERTQKWDNVSTDHPNFVEHVLAIARATPAREYARYRRGNEFETITYGQLGANATRYAMGLAALGVERGDVVGLILDDNAEIAQVFLGAMILGALPAVLAPPAVEAKVSGTRYAKMLEGLIARAEPAMIVTHARVREPMAQIWSSLDLRLGVFDGVDISNAAIGLPKIGLAPSITDEDPAFLQHSSGTTGLQKGVIITHGMLRRQMEVCRELLRYTADDITVSWLPLYHDLGLLGCMLLPMYGGGMVVQLDTFQWLARPAILLDEIERHRATLTWMPNFAFLHLANKAAEAGTWDLSTIRRVVSCGEPVTAHAVQRFEEAFGPLGLRDETVLALYGMAENVLCVAGTAFGEPANEVQVNLPALREGRLVPVQSNVEHSRTLLSCGRPCPGTQIRIVSEGSPAADGVLGEIQLTGDCTFQGYYRNPEATARAFDGEWYRTGDLGAVLDGEVFVLGRRDDMLIIGGKNIHPKDLEEAASQSGWIHPGRTAAVGVRDEQLGTERIVLFVERPRDSSEESTDDLIAAKVAESVAGDTGVLPSRVIVLSHGWLMKSTSGKISRRLSYEKALREGLVDATLI